MANSKIFYVIFSSPSEKLFLRLKKEIQHKESGIIAGSARHAVFSLPTQGIKGVLSICENKVRFLITQKPSLMPYNVIAFATKRRVMRLDSQA
ncbi:MAG: hypothetical protein AUK35_08935 [Zetaproteobacteria bacterium CG2_30_46_52]|nr:MAG: hypothetical protein AUK35_08935 [Zetaproteobacteria bacterium CG2_30_46_52]